MHSQTCYFTGHRPQDLLGSRADDNVELILMGREIIIDLIENRGVFRFYAGGAQGWDTWMAKVIIALRRDYYPHIKLILAIPCKGQWQAWTPHAPEAVYEWLTIFEEADEVEYVHDGYYEQWVLPHRNTYMVDRGLYCISAWNSKQSGGTYDCIKKSRKKNRLISIINPATLEVRKENW